MKEKASPNRDLSEHPGDAPGDRLDRVARGALVPGAGKPHGTATHVIVELYVPTKEDLEAVRIKREAALDRLGPKKKSKER